MNLINYALLASLFTTEMKKITFCIRKEYHKTLEQNEDDCNNLFVCFPIFKLSIEPRAFSVLPKDANTNTKTKQMTATNSL